MLKRINEMAKLIKDINTQLTSYLRDTNVPLDERFKVYCAAVREDVLTEVKSYYWDSKVLNELGVGWYDDFYLDRYCTKYLTDLFDRVEVGWKGMTEEQFVRFKEEVVQSGIAGFNYDW